MRVERPWPILQSLALASRLAAIFNTNNTAARTPYRIESPNFRNISVLHSQKVASKPTILKVSK